MNSRRLHLKGHLPKPVSGLFSLVLQIALPVPQRTSWPNAQPEKTSIRTFKNSDADPTAIISVGLSDI